MRNMNKTGPLTSTRQILTSLGHHSGKDGAKKLNIIYKPKINVYDTRHENKKIKMHNQQIIEKKLNNREGEN